MYKKSRGDFFPGASSAAWSNVCGVWRRWHEGGAAAAHLQLPHNAHTHTLDVGGGWAGMV